MQFFMNLFRVSRPKYNTDIVKTLTTKKVIKEKKQKLTRKTDNQHALSDALITILRANEYTFNTIALVLNILKIKPKLAKVYSCDVARMQYNRLVAMDKNGKTVIN